MSTANMDATAYRVPTSEWDLGRFLRGGAWLTKSGATVNVYRYERGWLLKFVSPGNRITVTKLSDDAAEILLRAFMPEYGLPLTAVNTERSP